MSSHPQPRPAFAVPTPLPLPPAAVSLPPAQKRLLEEALFGALGPASQAALAAVLASDEFRRLDMTAQRGLLSTFRRRDPRLPAPFDKVERRRVADATVTGDAERMLRIVRSPQLQAASTPAERWDVIRSQYICLRR